MFVGTHAAFPVILMAVLDLPRRGPNRFPKVPTWGFVAAGIAGILPDLLSPHLSLHARLTSWTHTIWFVLGTLALAWLLGRRWGLDLRLLLAVWSGILLHLLVDMVSGGINPLYPFGSRVGIRTVPFRYWWLADLMLVPLALALAVRSGRFRGLPAFENADGPSSGLRSKAEENARPGEKPG